MEERLSGSAQLDVKYGDALFGRMCQSHSTVVRFQHSTAELLLLLLLRLLQDFYLFIYSFCLSHSLFKWISRIDIKIKYRISFSLCQAAGRSRLVIPFRALQSDMTPMKSAQRSHLFKRDSRPFKYKITIRVHRSCTPPSKVCQ